MTLFQRLVQKIKFKEERLDLKLARYGVDADHLLQCGYRICTELEDTNRLSGLVYLELVQLVPRWR